MPCFFYYNLSKVIPASIDIMETYSPIPSLTNSDFFQTEVIHRGESRVK